MNSAEECVSPVNRAESVELISSDSSRPMSTDHNNTMARLEKVRADRLKRMSFTRESPVIEAATGRPQSMKLQSSASPRHDGLGSRPASMRLSPRADANRDFTVNSPRNDGSSTGSRSPITVKASAPQVSPSPVVTSPMSQSMAYSTMSTPGGAHQPLSNSSLNSTMPLMTPTHLQGQNDTLDSIELFLLSPEKQPSIRSDVALASNTVDFHDDHRDGYEKSLHHSANPSHNESNNSFDSDVHSTVIISPRIPVQMKRQSSQNFSLSESSGGGAGAGAGVSAAQVPFTPADRAAAAAMAAANAALSGSAAAASTSTTAATGGGAPQLSPVFTRPKELPPTLSQEAMRKPSLTALEFAQLVSQDASLSVLEQVKADRMNRRTNTDPSITATLSRSQEDVTVVLQQQQQQKYYALPQSGSSHSLASTSTTNSSMDLKNKNNNSNSSNSSGSGTATTVAAPAVLEGVDMTPASLQSQMYLKTSSISSNNNPQLMSTQKKLMSDLIDPPGGVSVHTKSSLPLKGDTGAAPEVSPSSVISVGYAHIPSYHESSSTFISPMGNPLPAPSQRQHNEELNQKIIAAMIAMNDKLANQVKNASHNHQHHQGDLHRNNSSSNHLPRQGSSNSLNDPRLRDPSDFLHYPTGEVEEAILRFPSADSGERRTHHQYQHNQQQLQSHHHHHNQQQQQQQHRSEQRGRGRERDSSPLPNGARFIRRVSIDQLDNEASAAAATAAASSAAAPARSVSPMRPGAAAAAAAASLTAQSNFRTDLHLNRTTAAAGRDRSRSPAPSNSLSSSSPYRDHSHSPVLVPQERRSLSPPAATMRPSPQQTDPLTGRPLGYNDSVPLIPERDLAKLMEMGLSEEEALNIYKEHVTMMLIPPEERATTGTSAMLNNSEMKRKRRILLRTHHHKKSTHHSHYNENQWGHHDEGVLPDNRYGSRRGSRDMLSSHNHHYAGMRSRTSSEDMVGSAIRRNSHQELFRTSSQQRMRLGSADHSYSAPAHGGMVRRSSNGSTTLANASAVAANNSSFAVRRGSNGSMSQSRGVGGKVSRQGSLDLGTISRRNSHNSSMGMMMTMQERYRPGSVDVTQQMMPLSRRGSHNSLTGGGAGGGVPHQTGRRKSGSIDLTLHNYPAVRRLSREAPVRRLSGDYGLGRIKMTKVNAAEIAANLLKTFESLAPLKELLSSPNGAAATTTTTATGAAGDNRRSSVSTLFGEVDDSVDPVEDSSVNDNWRPALNEYLQRNQQQQLQHHHHIHGSGVNNAVNVSGVLYDGYDDPHGVHRMQTLSEESELS